MTGLKRKKSNRSYNWLIYKIVNQVLEKRVRRYTSRRMIDIGCGEKPYREMVAPYVVEHIGVDHEDYVHDKTNIELMETTYSTPVNSESFDSLFCTLVLEHLEEPCDFYQDTKHGLSYLFEKNNFEVVEIKALSGFYVTFTLEFLYFINRFRGKSKLNPLWWVIPPSGMLIQYITCILNKADHFEIFTIEYVAVIRKCDNT